MNSTEEIIVRSYEIDRNSHVNNAVYHQYMEFGRVRVFLKSGAMERLIEEGNKLAIVNANVDFKGQALLDDRLIIETSFTIEGIRICFDQKIFRVEPEPRILITKGINSVVVINSKQKPVKPPQYLIQAMNNLIIK